MRNLGFAYQPGQGEPIADSAGRVTRVWANYFAKLALVQTSDELRDLYLALAERVGKLEDGQALTIIGRDSVRTVGTGQVEIQLVGDEDAPGSTEYYGTNAAGEKGFHPVADAIEVEVTELTKAVGLDGITTLGLADVPDSGTGTLQAITVDSKGRVTGTKDATITGTAGQIAVANGNASSGLPTISLVDVPDAGGGTLQKTQFDAKGRKTGTSAATTDNLPEGSTNLYYTDTRADARATLAVDAHVAEADPHPQYATPAEAAAASPVQSINGQVGDVALGASDVGADEVGTAAAAIASHVSQPNPHAQYLRSRIDQPIGVFQDPDIADGIVSVCANGVSNPTPAIEAWADNGSTQANISSTTFGVNGGGIFHGRMARGTKASPSGVLKGDVYCGFGGRPFAAGYGFLQSSPVSLHWVAAENQTSTGYGGYFRILTTKIGTTQRAESAIITDNGVIWAHDQQVVYDPTSYAQTSFLTGYTGMLVSSHNQQARHVIVSYGGLPSVNICGTAGTPSAPAALGAAANMGVLAFTTYAGSWVAPGIVIARTTEAHSATAQGTEMVFGTTANGSASRVERWKFAASGDLLPVADNAYDVGGSAARPKQLWAMSGTINTSDAREKTSVRPFTPIELAAAVELGREIGVYQWLAMTATKGDGARQHIGMTVQRAIEIMQGHGLDPFAYGFICYDQWDELLEVAGEDGEIVQEARPAGDRYSFRMDELLAFIARGLAHRLDGVEQRLRDAGL